MTTNPQPAVRVDAARYRKKPVVIEAVQWDGDQRTFDMIERWVGKAVSDTDGYTLLIPTLEGVMEASLNDWIIRGVKGEVYPCKPDIFAITYEPALTPAPTEAGGVREPTKAVIAALAAAISLLERTPRAKKAAPSDRMFDQMLTDYRKALEDGRAALSSTPAADAEWCGPYQDAATALESLRRSVAEILGCDPETWPPHKNAPLSIACSVQLGKSAEARADRAEAELASLREKVKADVAAAYEDAARVAYDTLAAWGDYGWKCQAEGLQEAIRARAALTTEEG